MSANNQDGEWALNLERAQIAQTIFETMANCDPTLLNLPAAQAPFSLYAGERTGHPDEMCEAVVRFANSAWEQNGMLDTVPTVVQFTLGQFPELLETAPGQNARRLLNTLGAEDRSEEDVLNLLPSATDLLGTGLNVDTFGMHRPQNPRPRVQSQTM